MATVAERYGRHFVHLDLSKKYCAITAERVAAEIKQVRLDEIPANVSENTPSPALIAEAKKKCTPRKKAKRK